MTDDTFEASSGGENNKDTQQNTQQREERPRGQRDDDRGDRGRERTREQDSEFTIGDYARTSARPTIGGVSDAALGLLVEAFENAKGFDKPGVPAETKRDKFKVVPLDSHTARCALSSLLICLPVQVGQREFALTYILFIEQPGGISTRALQERGESYDALVLPEDHITEKYLSIVKQQVAGLMPGTFVDAGRQIILASTIASLGEKDGQAQLGRIFDNALDAICGTRENLIDALSGNRDVRRRLNPNMIGRGDRLEVTFDYTGKQVRDSSGLPIRSDVTTELFYSANTREDEDDMYTRTPMGVLRAALDLFISDDAMDDDKPRFGRSRRRGGRDEEEPFWQPVLNITDIDSAPGFPFSLELAQMLIAQIGLQTNDYRWATMLRPRVSMADGLKPIVELDHLMLMNPDESKAVLYDDLTPNMTDQDLSDYLDITVKPNVAIGMMLPSSGAKSWALSIFERIATAKDPRERDKLIDVLYKSADTLTGGRFSKRLDSLANGAYIVPVRTTGSRGLLGTWEQEGKVRSLSEWNVPAMATAVAQKNREMVRDYQVTFDDVRYSVDYNLSQRAGILQRVVPGLRIVDSCEMLSLHPIYVRALGEALDEARMSPHVASTDGLATRRQLGNSTYRELATADIGVARRRRNDDGRSRDRRDYSLKGDTYY